MWENIMEAPDEFNKAFDFATREAFTPLS